MLYMVNLGCTHKFHPENTKRWNSSGTDWEGVGGCVWGLKNGLLAHKENKLMIAKENKLMIAKGKSKEEN